MCRTYSIAKSRNTKWKEVTSYPGFDNDLKESIYKEDLVVQDKIS